MSDILISKVNSFELALLFVERLSGSWGNLTPNARSQLRDHDRSRIPIQGANMRLTWLPEVLKAAGLKVETVSGWKTRGSSSWGPIRGITCHATAGARNGSTSGEISVLINGSNTAPPPIAQLYLARNGTYHVVASGMCFHNLTGWGGPNKDLGNGNLIGIEAGNDNRGEPWPAVQLDAYKRGVAAICRHLGISSSRVAAHWEHQPGNKSDPKGINIEAFRRDVKALINGDDMDANERLPLPEFARKRWPTAGTKGTIAAHTGVTGGYAYGRLNYEEQTKFKREVLAGQAAILASVGGGNLDQIQSAIRAELDRAAIREKAERAQEREELVEPLAAAVVAAGGVEISTEAVEEAIRAVFGSLDE